MSNTRTAQVLADTSFLNHLSDDEPSESGGTAKAGFLNHLGDDELSPFGLPS